MEWKLGVRSGAEETGAGKQDGEDWGGRVLEGQVRKRSKGQSWLTRKNGKRHTGSLGLPQLL